MLGFKSWMISLPDVGALLHAASDCGAKALVQMLNGPGIWDDLLSSRSNFGSSKSLILRPENWPFWYSVVG